MMKVFFLVALVAVLSFETVSATGDAAPAFQPQPIGRCSPKDIPNKPDRFLPDANDCRIYYRCSAGTPIMMECPEGTCFNRGTKGCKPSDE